MAKKDSKENFFQNVYEVVQLIPRGRVTSYGAIANYLGAKGSARMVGWALIAAHPFAGSKVPTHRVVNRSGLLTGKHNFEEPNAMQERLEQDGVQVENDRVVNFEQLFWDPSEELL